MDKAQMTNFDYAADALRRHEQAGKNLNPWHQIAGAQKLRWREKVKVVVKALADFPAGPIV